MRKRQGAAGLCTVLHMDKEYRWFPILRFFLCFPFVCGRILFIHQMSPEPFQGTLAVLELAVFNHLSGEMLAQWFLIPTESQLTQRHKYTACALLATLRAI